MEGRPMSERWVKVTLAKEDDEIPVGAAVYVNLAQAGAISPCWENGKPIGWKVWLSPNQDGWEGFYVVNESPEELLDRVVDATRT
jgi:endo-alpha-1,4-polygalactosaminidase (GH114 family)